MQMADRCFRRFLSALVRLALWILDGWRIRVGDEIYLYEENLPELARGVMRLW